MHFSFGFPFDVIQFSNVVFIGFLSFSRQRTSFSVMSVLLWDCFAPAFFLCAQPTIFCKNISRQWILFFACSDWPLKLPLDSICYSPPVPSSFPRSFSGM